MKGKILFSGAAAILAVWACSNPNGPTPPPRVTPTPALPTPTPRPQMRPFDPSMIPDLKGATTCCADDDESNGDEGSLSGWPYVDDNTLDLYQRTGVNFTEVRIGPNGEGNGDLPPAEALAKLDERLSAAEQRGVYVIVGLVDAWVIAHGFNYWGDSCEVMRHGPRPEHLAWVRDVISVTRRHVNAVVMDGNEEFRCRPRAVWVNSLIEEARIGGAAWVGSNAGLGLGDFTVTHGFRAVGPGEILLESDNRPHSVEDWLTLRRNSTGLVVYWRGPMSQVDWVRLLEAQ